MNIYRVNFGQLTRIDVAAKDINSATFAAQRIAKEEYSIEDDGDMEATEVTLIADVQNLIWTTDGGVHILTTEAEPAPRLTPLPRPPTRTGGLLPVADPVAVEDRECGRGCRGTAGKDER